MNNSTLFEMAAQQGFTVLLLLTLLFFVVRYFRKELADVRAEMKEVRGELQKKSDSWHNELREMNKQHISVIQDNTRALQKLLPVIEKNMHS